MRGERVTSVFIALATVATPQVSASQMSMKMFGHSVEIVSTKDGQEQLVVDQKVLLKDQYIWLREVATVEDVPSVVGERSGGGNICDGSVFVLSFPIAARAKIDGPLDSCNSSETTVESRRIVVRVAPTPQTEGSQWTWSPSSGFSTEQTIPFAAKQADGWTALRSRVIDHPSGLLDYADLTQSVNGRVGKAKDSFVRLSSGPGHAEYRNNLLIATSCQAHSCDDTSLLVVADIAARKVFVAIRDATAPALITPQASEWPTSARTELSAFQRKWDR